MCQDLAGYDPFEPLIFDDSEYEEWYYFSYPMTDEDWEEFLEADDYF